LSDSRFPAPETLVVRAAFVPDGEEPPPELSGVFDPIIMRASLDPATGIITCDNGGIAYEGDVRADWHPDEERDGGEADGSDERNDDEGTSDPSDAPDDMTAG
jgi:hypothetical protein